jgi:hypothetical protein
MNQLKPRRQQHRFVTSHFKMTIRKTIILTFSILTFQTFGQVLTHDFTGQIKYNINFYSAFIRYDSCGDYKAKRTLVKKNDFFQVNDTTIADSKTESQQYLLTKFISDKQFLKLVYFNPINKSNDTVNQFPLNKGDTIESREDYLLYTESKSYWDTKEKKSYWKEGISPSYSKTTNIGDTTLTVLGQVYSCYRFEKFNYNRKSKFGPSDQRHIIYIDKKSLLPLREDWIYWYYKHHCIPIQQWFLKKSVEIVEIKNGW